MSDDAAVTLLKVACDNAYDLYPDSCSGSVWKVIVTRVKADEPHRQANELITHMSANWTEINCDDAWTSANKGVVVVAGLSGRPNGHVVVIYPGAKIESGGYSYFDKKAKKSLKLRSHGKYPTCMSTSIGSWPGAMSKGDKTVWDPWANDALFAKLKFWTPKV